MSRIRSFDQRTFKARTFLSIWGKEDEFSAVASAEISATVAASGVVGVSGAAHAELSLTATAIGTFGTEVLPPLPVYIVPVGGGFTSHRIRQQVKPRKKIAAVEGDAAAVLTLEARATAVALAPPAITGTASAVMSIAAHADADFTNMIPWDNDDLMMLAA